MDSHSVLIIEIDGSEWRWGELKELIAMFGLDDVLTKLLATQAAHEKLLVEKGILRQADIDRERNKWIHEHEQDSARVDDLLSDQAGDDDDEQ